MLCSVCSIFLFTCRNRLTERKNITSSEAFSGVSSKDFREFKVLDSKFINIENLWKPFEKDLKDFTEVYYTKLKPLILEQNILSLQNHILDGKLTYEDLVKFYLYRIRSFDRENKFSLNSIIALNPNVIKDAITADNNKLKALAHPIFGMPIIIKDNINAYGMPTTAGAVALKHNNTKDAFIVKRLKENGAIILGKSNLSEWAYYFCGDCPSGYSAIGGQTLNPYGRRTIDTGGSSSGSGVAIAANFAVAALGSETSGSILSPSSQNSVVGLKPTIGLISRRGIVPISSTLDTAGPMTKNVIDNAILLDAISGYDTLDSKAIKFDIANYFISDFNHNYLKGKRFAVVKRLLEDSLYHKAISNLKSKGTIIIEIEEQNVDLPHFLRLLNLDMKRDLSTYLSNYADTTLSIKSVEDVINFNKKDSLTTMPYGQELFEGIVADNATDMEFANIKTILKANGKAFFDIPFKHHNLDGFLSINNYHASFAAVAEYPAITVPMGYTKNSEPKGLTFIGKPFSEKSLLNWAYTYEQVSKKRIAPNHYN